MEKRKVRGVVDFPFKGRQGQQRPKTACTIYMYIYTTAKQIRDRSATRFATPEFTDQSNSFAQGD